VVGDGQRTRPATLEDIPEVLRPLAHAWGTSARAALGPPNPWCAPDQFVVLARLGERAADAR
jgi:hypothetical protein